MNSYPPINLDDPRCQAQQEEARARLAEWRDFIANALTPETADSVQESAIAENQARQLPYR